MSRQIRHLHLRGALGKVHREMFRGKEHLVIPVVALMEGVIHAVNAETPEFVSEKTLLKAAHSWNGRPITLGHPARNGKQISANDLHVLNSQAFGTVLNSRVVNKRLLMDAYVDPDRVVEVGDTMRGPGEGQKLLESLEDGRMCEVSVGAFVETDDNEGDYNNKHYKAAWLETAGDHLAFLPGGRGACSIEMGCGAHRAAEQHAYLVTAEEFRECDWNEDDHPRGPDGKFGPGSGGDKSDDKSGWSKPPATEKPPTKIKDKDGKVWTRVNKSDSWITSKGQTGRAIFRRPGDDGKEIEVAIPYATYRRGSNYRHVGHDQIGSDYKALADNTEDDSPRSLRDRLLSLFAPLVDGLKDLASYEDCPVCKGSGNVNGNPCEKCDGEGEFAIDKTEKQPRKLADGKLLRDCSYCSGVGQLDDENGELRDCDACDGDGTRPVTLDTTADNDDDNGQGGESAISQGDSEMKTKADKIKALVACPCSGFKSSDIKALEALDETRIDELQATADERKKAEEKTATELATAQAALKAATQCATCKGEGKAFGKECPDCGGSGELKAAELAAKVKTLESQQIPAEELANLRSLAAVHKAQEAEEKAGLVTVLEGTQKVYDKAKLEAMPVQQLRDLAAIAKVDAPKVDYSLRGIPQQRTADDKAESFTPPDPWERDLKVAQAAYKH